MPAPGAQHNAVIPNPFAEDISPAISAYTAQEIATLQSRLERQLGPEYISSRAGPNGQKVHYLAAEKCIQLANEVFGFNGWSSSIRELQVDFVDENPTTGKVSLGLSVIVRVTLRDGTFHEDIGYGNMENCKGKAAAFEKAKKEGTTDALKRALKNFGNVLGNCLHDKEYLAKVTKVKAAPSSKWNVEELHRHSTYAPIKKDPEPALPEKTSIPVPDMPNGESLDEFGDFDAADFSCSHDSISHPDEVMLPASEHPTSIGANIAPIHNADPFNNPSEKIEALDMKAPPRPNKAGQTSTGLNKALSAPQPQTPKGVVSRSNGSAGSNLPTRIANETAEPVHVKPQQFFAVRVGRVPGIYETWAESNQQTNGFPGAQSKSCSSRQLAEAYLAERETSSASKAVQHAPPQTTGNLSASKSNISSDHGSSSKQHNDLPEVKSDGAPTAEAAEEAPAFFSARAVKQLPPNTDEFTTFAAAHMLFDPRAESPSIRKTPGIDHNRTWPTTRELKQVKIPTEGAQSPAASSNPRPNITHPHLDAARKVGVPGSPSPAGNRGNNRGQYKPPTILKRPAEDNGVRTPLNDKTPNEPVRVVGGDVKRQRVYEA